MLSFCFMHHCFKSLMSLSLSVNGEFSLSMVGFVCS